MKSQKPSMKNHCEKSGMENSFRFIDISRKKDVPCAQKKLYVIQGVD